MSKFSQLPAAPPTHVVRTTTPAYTHEGGVGFSREARSELFLLAVTNMVREGTFYESAEVRDGRFAALIHQVAQDDPDWLGRFVPYLRDEMNLRSAALVMAAEYVKGGGPHGRGLVDAALQRADEPAEMLGYWYATHGRNLPAAIKRGVADAAVRLYTERAALKYDGASRGWRMGDVLDLTHPKPKAEWQSALFRYLIDRRHGRDSELHNLPIVQAVAAWDAGPSLELPEGVTWERLAGTRTMDAAAWEAVIPQMGYMALLRNLRNFDEAGVSDQTAAQVVARLSDPEQVSKSRQLPFRFYNAWANVPSVRWAAALEKGLELSLRNVPALTGRTLILIDLSGSMQDTYSTRAKGQRWQLASLFGVALAKRAEQAEVVAYSNHGLRVDIPPTASVLRAVESFGALPGMFGGTSTFAVLSAAFSGHDRIVILTDEQAQDAGYTNLPDVPLYTFNLAGYAPAHMESGPNRYSFGGLSDAGFKVLEILEGRRNGGWPF